MKTNIIRLLVAVFGLFLMACVLSQSANAQTIVSMDTSPDNTLVVKIQNPSCLNSLHRLIFIIDSASFTYEFDGNGGFSSITASADHSAGEVPVAILLFMENRLRRLRQVKA